jgi:hypothetical protein
MSDELEKEKVILENLYRCRDIEINNLWQKSMFLGTLLALCFTGYGVLLFSMITAKKEVLFNYNLLCFAICFISIIFSILWIYMFKGSKAHYELYERAISKFEKDKFKKNEEFVMGNLSVEAPIDNNLFSTKAGGFSPSKINIMIGQLSLILWMLGMIGHLSEILGCSLLYNIIYTLKINKECYSIYIIIFFILCLIIFYRIRKNVESSYFRPNGNNSNN